MAKPITPIIKARLALIPHLIIVLLFLVYFYTTGKNEIVLFNLFIFILFSAYSMWVGMLSERTDALAILKLYGIDEMKYDSLKSDIEEGVYIKSEDN